MVLHMTHERNIRAYLRAINGLSVDRQREMCERASGGAHVTYYDGHEREAWIRALRSDEAALVARLEIIPEPKRPDGLRPAVDFVAAMSELLRRSAVLIEAETGTTSADGAKWRRLVEYTGTRVASGMRRLPRKRAKAMSSVRWGKADRGVKAKWLSSGMRAELARWGQHWRDPKYQSAEAAFRALPDEMQLEFRSVHMMRAIFGGRRPGDPSAGGRPPKRRRKR